MKLQIWMKTNDLIYKEWSKSTIDHLGITKKIRKQKQKLSDTEKT